MRTHAAKTTTSMPAPKTDTDVCFGSSERPTSDDDDFCRCLTDGTYYDWLKNNKRANRRACSVCVDETCRAESGKMDCTRKGCETGQRCVWMEEPGVDVMGVECQCGTCVCSEIDEGDSQLDDTGCPQTDSTVSSVVDRQNSKLSAVTRKDPRTSARVADAGNRRNIGMMGTRVTSTTAYDQLPEFLGVASVCHTHVAIVVVAMVQCLLFLEKGLH